ncbi:MAG: DUF1801 domain-containing protein [Alphaproteobacteria bacterium]
MSDVPRLKDTKQHDPRIDEWLDSFNGDLAAIAREATRMVRFYAVGGTEILQDDQAVTCIDAAPFAYVAMRPDHVRLGFFQGASLPDPTGLLTGTDKAERYIALAPRAGLDAAVIADLIQAAYDDMSLRASGTH